MPRMLWLLTVFWGMVGGRALKNFLDNGRAALTKSGPIVFCIGNEAADADSIVSSVCYGFLKQYTALKATNPPETHVVPLVSIPRSVLKLRPETEMLLKMVHLELEDLICVEEVDLHSLGKANERIEGLILTDHNSLSGSLRSMFDQDHPHDLLVREIIDHHIDSKDCAHVRGTARNIAFDSTTGRATAGSTCTLVAESMISVKDELDTETRMALSTLLSGVILIDTQNMRSSGPGTNRDAVMLQELLESPTFLHNRLARDQVAENLRGAKTDLAFWTSLTAHQSLVIDYKQFRATENCEFGMSTIACSISDFMKKPRVREVIQDYIRDPRLELVAVMSSYEHAEEGYSRELLLVSHSSALLDDLILGSPVVMSTLDLSPLPLPLNWEEEKERVEEREKEQPLDFRIFKQGNLKASRKQVAPLLQAGLKRG